METRLGDALVKMQTEWIEMPHLKLTARQAERLWSLSSEVCAAAFMTLIQKGFLVQASDGSYLRRAFLHSGAYPMGVLNRTV